MYEGLFIARTSQFLQLEARNYFTKLNCSNTNFILPSYRRPTICFHPQLKIWTPKRQIATEQRPPLCCHRRHTSSSSWQIRGECAAPVTR